MLFTRGQSFYSQQWQASVKKSMNFSVTNLTFSHLKPCLCQTASEIGEFQELHCEPVRITSELLTTYSKSHYLSHATLAIIPNIHFCLAGLFLAGKQIYQKAKCDVWVLTGYSHQSKITASVLP